MAAQPARPWEQIGEAFLKHYYQHFDGDRTQLMPLFVSCTAKDTSLLTSERETVQGAQKILEKLSRLPAMHHTKMTSVQYQPTPQNAILILVSGDIRLHGETNELKFSEVFQLVADQNNSFYIQNNIFVLNYG